MAVRVEVVPVAVGVAVGVPVRVAVAVVVAVLVAVGVGVIVTVGVPVAVAVGEGVLVAVTDGVAVRVAVAVGVASGASLPTPLSVTCWGALEALSEIVRVPFCCPLAAGLNFTPISHLPPTRMLDPQVMLLTSNSGLPMVMLLITTAPLFDFGFDNLSVFRLLVVPNF